MTIVVNTPYLWRLTNTPNRVTVVQDLGCTMFLAVLINLVNLTNLTVIDVDGCTVSLLA